MDRYPKRLIEVDLPIKRISAHARREKSIRHGHISTLHIWWARRPLAACRAVICASLWPDPADSLCPERFKKEVSIILREFRERRGGKRKNWADPIELRNSLLDFIADFSNWDNACNKDFLTVSRKLSIIAHESLGGALGTNPMVLDPFAGGGAIPLEALRVGCDAFASDLNPVAILLNKVLIEYIPQYGQKLIDEIRKQGELIKKELEKELKEFYPTDEDGGSPISYLWARTIVCEGPGCGAEVPLLKSLWLLKKGGNSMALRMLINKNKKHVDFEIVSNVKEAQVGNGTIKRGAVTCPICGYATPVTSVRKQLKKRDGGTWDSRLFCVVTIRKDQQGRRYRLPNRKDFKAYDLAREELLRRIKDHKGKWSLVPNELMPSTSSGFIAPPTYGMDNYGLLFNARQALTLSAFQMKTFNLGNTKNNKNPFENAVQTCIALAVDRCVDKCASLVVWDITRDMPTHVFGRQALGMVWDYAEANPLCEASGGWDNALNWILKVCEACALANYKEGIVQQVSATQHSLPDDCVDAFITDPPYYNAVPYADLSDFFYVWLKRMLSEVHPDLFRDSLTPKANEVCEMSGWDSERYANKDKLFYENEMRKALSEGRRMLRPNGIGVVVFAHKTTAGWEALLSAMIDAGWVVTGSWPIDTEMANRLRAQNSAVLASSVHIVCRPRENEDGSVKDKGVGDWRDILQELPKRIHEWMPRLAEEGVVGADAIFACIGPALEIFSRYSRVEKASGEVVALKEYLEQVWAAVAKEALTMIFTGADATGFEEDARLTAMWLWTLKTGETNGAKGEDAEEESSDDEEGGGKKAGAGAFVLEFDAARKIAQGLGAHLEWLPTVVEAKGETARLLSVGERATHLFGKESSGPKERPREKKAQPSLFAVMDEVQEEVKKWEIKTGKIGETVLDRVHQSMILFGAGRGEALRRFLVEDGVGRDQRLWRLAQALSALYPTGTDEKRWVDGVLARKKGLGL